MNEHRCRIVYVDQKDILNVFDRVHRADFDCISLPKFDLPDGYKVLGVQYDFGRDAFAFKVQHESFDEVKPGGVYPTHNGGVNDVRTAYRRVLEVVRWESSYDAAKAAEYEKTVNAGPLSHPLSGWPTREYQITIEVPYPVPIAARQPTFGEARASALENTAMFAVETAPGVALNSLVEMYKSSALEDAKLDAPPVSEKPKRPSWEFLGPPL